MKAAISRAWAAGAFEVIVVDGGSDDNTARIAQQTNAQLVTCVSGRGQQINLGAAHASGEILLFQHADNWLPDNALQQINAAMSQGDLHGGGFRQRLQSSRWIYRLIEFGNAFRARNLRLVYGDQGMFVRRSVFEQLGGFAEIPLMEDYEFSQRCFRDSAPLLLDGPIHVDVRRWERDGVVRTTINNWRIARAWRQGVDVNQLYELYYNRGHD
jgi:rSAM/selenodomain-associated transferase 2